MKPIPLTIILLVILIIIAFFLLEGEEINLPDIKDDFFTENSDPDQNSENLESDENAPANNNLDSLLNTGGGGGGGGSGGSTSGSSGSVNCQQNQISYALKDFIKDSECLSYSGNICISKTLTCSVDVYNLDQSTSGTFEMKISIIEAGGNIIVQEFILSEEINPQQFHKFEKILQF